MGSPAWPWQEPQTCTFASMASCAFAGSATTATSTTAPEMVEKRFLNMLYTSLVGAHGPGWKTERDKADEVRFRPGFPRQRPNRRECCPFPAFPQDGSARTTAGTPPWRPV